MDSSAAPSPTSPQANENQPPPAREPASAASWHPVSTRPASRPSVSESHMNHDYSFPAMPGTGHGMKASSGSDHMRSNDTTPPTYRFPSISADNLVAATASMEPGSAAFLHAHPFGMHIPMNSFDGNDSGYASSTAPYSSNSQYVPSLDHTYGSASVSSHNTSPTHPDFSTSAYGTSSMRTSEPAYYDERPGAMPMDARMPTIAVSGNNGYHSSHYPEYIPQSDEFSPSLPNAVDSAYGESSRGQNGKASDQAYFQFPAHRPSYASGHNMSPLKTHSSALDSQSNPNFAVHYHQHHSTTTHTTSSSSTYIPNSAYIPSKSSFNGLSPSTPSPAPKSAPSTPLGRQDARFLSSRGWATPQPLQPPMFAGQHNILASPLPGGPSNGYGGPPIMHDGPLMSPFPDEYSSVYAPYDGTSQYALPGSSYMPIPYVRSTKPAKRQSASYSKDGTVKRKKQERIMSQDPDIPTQGLGLSDSLNDADVKPRQQRCKIACSACRKTRLRCDGNIPCTSCVDKYLKVNTMATAEDAANYIATHGTCIYENFVRRRGKGKKTLEREREDGILRHMRDASIMSGPPDFQVIHAIHC